MSGTERENRYAWLIGLLAVVGTLIAWSIAPLLIRSFRGVVDPHTNNAFRYSIGALIWMPLLWRAVRRGEAGAATFRRAWIPLAWNVVGQICFSMAFYEIDPGLVTFGLRSQIVAVALVAPFMFPRERAVMRAPAFVAGLVMVLTGVLTMAWLGIEASRSGALDTADPWSVVRGFALALFAGVGYAGYGLGVRKHLDGVPHTISFAVIGLTTALAMIGVMLVASPTHGMIVFDASLPDYARLLLTGIIGIGISHVMFYFAMERLGVALSTGIIQVQPVLVASASAFIYSELLSPLQWTFGALAIAGAITMVVAQHRIHQRTKAVPELDAGEEADVAHIEAQEHEREAEPAECGA